MTTYHIRYTVNKKWQPTIKRQSLDMNACLASTKAALTSKHGEAMGGIMICGPQGDEEIYNFG